jgi:hypothetical protein
MGTSSASYGDPSDPANLPSSSSAPQISSSSASSFAGAFGLAGTGFAMYADYLKSRGEKAADIFKAEELEQQAAYGRLKADQVNAQKTRNLAITLSHIDAVRAAAHTDPTSPTGAAVRGTVEERETEAKNITVENILQQARMDEANAAYMRSAGSNALLAGNFQMFADVAQGITGAAKAFAPG